MTPELSQAYAAAELATEKVARLTERVRELEAVLSEIQRWPLNMMPNMPDDAVLDIAAYARAALAKREGG